MSFVCDTTAMKLKASINKVSLTVIIIVGAIGILGLGIHLGKNIEKGDAANGAQGLQGTMFNGLDLAPMQKVMDALNEKFIPTTASSSVPNNQDKVWGAIEGLTAAYGDPYTIFFPPKETSAFQEEVRGDFEGIGMEVDIKDKVLTVVAPLKGTPAERAGVKSGDQVLKINKTETNKERPNQHKLILFKKNKIIPRSGLNVRQKLKNL